MARSVSSEHLSGSAQITVESGAAEWARVALAAISALSASTTISIASSAARFALRIHVRITELVSFQTALQCVAVRWVILAHTVTTRLPSRLVSNRRGSGVLERMVVSAVPLLLSVS